MFFTSGVSGVDLATGVMPDDPAEQFLKRVAQSARAGAGGGTLDRRDWAGDELHR